MADEPAEEFELCSDDDLEQFYGREIARSRVRTANVVTLLLVSAVIATPIAYIWALLKLDNGSVDNLEAFFEHWFALVGPLVGTAVGFYFGTAETRRTAS